MNNNKFIKIKNATRYPSSRTKFTTGRSTLHATPLRAFGLIEVVVSTAIILIVAGAALSLGRLALKNSVVSYERTQAYNLAREGIENMRAQRDDLWENETRLQSFSEDLSEMKVNINNPSNPFYLNPSPELDNTTYQRLVSLATDTEMVLNLNTAIGINPSDQVAITDNSLQKVTVIVTWNSYGKDKRIELATVLTDWKPADYGWGIEY